MPVTFLMFDAYGAGGVARTVTNLANALAGRARVRVVSLFRHVPQPRFALDTGVELDVLVDLYRGLGPIERRRHRQPSRLQPSPVECEFSALTDAALHRAIGSLEGGVLVSTRPSLHLAASRFAAPATVVIGQDHKNFPTRFRNRQQAEVLTAAVPALDALVVLTDADARDYRQRFGHAAHIQVIRNGLGWEPAQQPAAVDRKVIIAAGRLVREKGFDRLLSAFASVAEVRPDWELHLYGQGPEQAALRNQIQTLGLTQQVQVKGYTTDLKQALAAAAIFVLTSRKEGFPMVLIEALSVGLPVVSFDCPRGPAEIIDHGHNGLLVSNGDLPGLARALVTLVEDDEMRQRMGRQALVTADRYTRSRIAADWFRLFERLQPTNAHTRSTATSPGIHPRARASAHGA